MSDKYLTVKEWQKFSAERAYQDTPAGKAMVKALGEAEKAANAPPTEQLKVLENLEAAGRELLKLYKGDKKLQSYLEDVYKPLKKHRKSAEKTQAQDEKAEPKAAARASSKADEDDDEDDEKAGALVDPKRLLAQLMLCRKNPQRRVHFCYVDGKDKEPAVLAVSPKVAGRRLFARLSEELGIKVGAYGMAWVDRTELMVQPDKRLGSLAKKMRAPVKGCGFLVTKIILVDPDGTVLEQDDASEGESGSEPGETSSAAVATTEQPAADGLAAQPTLASTAEAEFTARLKALLPRVAAAAATQEGRAAKLLVSEAGVFARKGDFASAMAGLEKAERLLASTSPAAPGPAPAPASADGDPAAAFNVRLAALMPQIKEALAAGQERGQRVKLLVSEAGVFARKREFDRANGLLDEAQGLLKPPPGKGTPGELSIFKLGKVRVEWIDVRLKAMAELERFGQILRDEYEDEPKEQAALARAIEHLHKTSASLNEQLADQLDRVLNADATQRAQQLETAREVLSQFVNFLETDRLMSVIDGNEYAPEMRITEPLRSKLRDIADALG